MSYKTILVHVDLSVHAAERMRVAATIAKNHDAHLVGAAMTGLSRFALTSLETAGADPVLESHRALLHQRAGRALDQFDIIAASVGVLSFERRLIDDEAAVGMALQARYSDLAVCSQSDPEEPAFAAMTDFAQYVILNCARPVLTVPCAGRFDSVGQRVLVAWNSSREATRAVSAALPFLKKADQVDIVVINPQKEPDQHGEQPGADIALYLARHGINANAMQESTRLDGGNALLSLAADQSSDLLVMGAYGHTRFREVLLGGVTRTILESMTIPVLFSH